MTLAPRFRRPGRSQRAGLGPIVSLQLFPVASLLGVLLVLLSLVLCTKCVFDENLIEILFEGVGRLFTENPIAHFVVCVLGCAALL